MPRKPKAAAPTADEGPPVSGIAGTFPETVAGLMVVSSLLTDLLGDGLREAKAAGELPPDLEDDAAQMLGYILGASHTIVRATVAAGLAPASVLEELDREVQLADD